MLKDEYVRIMDDFLPEEYITCIVIKTICFKRPWRVFCDWTHVWRSQFYSWYIWLIYLHQNSIYTVQCREQLVNRYPSNIRDCISDVLLYNDTNWKAVNPLNDVSHYFPLSKTIFDLFLDFLRKRERYQRDIRTHQSKIK